MMRGKILAAIIVSAVTAAPAFADVGSMRGGLPPTTMDSFVTEAQEYAEFIYGDEGIDSIPPYFGFDTPSRINTGIFDRRDQGLTTGHGSYLPDAWGRDEFLAGGQEWSKSGPRGVSASSGFSQGTPNTYAPVTGQGTAPGGTLPGAGEGVVPGSYTKLPGSLSSKGQATGAAGSGNLGAAAGTTTAPSDTTPLATSDTSASNGLNWGSIYAQSQSGF